MTQTHRGSRALSRGRGGTTLRLLPALTHAPCESLKMQPTGYPSNLSKATRNERLKDVLAEAKGTREPPAGRKAQRGDRMEPC